MAKGRLVRVLVRLAKGHHRTVWARRIDKRGNVFLSVLTSHEEWTGEIILAKPEDVLNERPARMNLKYAELEVEK